MRQIKFILIVMLLLNNSCFCMLKNSSSLPVPANLPGNVPAIRRAYTGLFDMTTKLETQVTSYERESLLQKREMLSQKREILSQKKEILSQKNEIFLYEGSLYIRRLLSAFAIESPLGAQSRALKLEELDFKAKVGNITLGHKKTANTENEILQSLRCTADLFNSIYRLVTTKSSVFAMDNGVVKNTTLASLIPGIWKALKAGPLSGVGLLKEYREKISKFIVEVGSLRTDSVAGKLLVDNEKNDPAVSAFLKCLNDLSHKNDENAILRRNKRLYFQVHQNVRWGLLYILCAVYYGIDMDFFDDYKTHKSGEWFPEFLVKKDTVSKNNQKETLVAQQMRSITNTTITSSGDTNLVETSTVTLNCMVEGARETKKIAYKTHYIDSNFIMALLSLTFLNSDKTNVL